MPDPGVPESPATVRLSIDGAAGACAPGTSVAAAILSRGGPAAWHVRSSVTGMPRGPLCGMGICFECRATVDGRPHERTCQLPVRDGMEILTDG